MRGQLSQLGGTKLISPLIDIVFNAMAAMFIFLIIYICIVRPNPVPPVHIVDEEFPDAVWYSSYEAGVSVVGGLQSHSFAIIEGTIPEGLFLNKRTGLLSGVPRPTSGGQSGEDFTFTVQVTCLADSVDQRQFTFHVNPVAMPFDPEEQPLRIHVEPYDLPEAIVGHEYEFAIGFLGGIEPYRARVKGALPPGIQLIDEGQQTGRPEDAGEYRLAGTPQVPGEYLLTIMVEDEQDHFGLMAAHGNPIENGREYRLSVRGVRPLDLSPALMRGRVGEDFVVGVIAIGGDGDYTWSITAGTLPPGLTLDPHRGTITGMPQAAGEDYAFSVGVRDGQGQAKQTFCGPVQILPARTDATILTEKMPRGRVGVEYHATLACTGLVEPLTWRLDSGELPPGLTMNGPVISGIPVTFGSASEIRVQVTDAMNRSLTATCRISIYPAPVRLQLIESRSTS